MLRSLVGHTTPFASSSISYAKHVRAPSEFVTQVCDRDGYFAGGSSLFAFRSVFARKADHRFARMNTDHR